MPKTTPDAATDWEVRVTITKGLDDSLGGMCRVEMSAVPEGNEELVIVALNRAIAMVGRGLPARDRHQ